MLTTVFTNSCFKHTYFLRSPIPDKVVISKYFEESGLPNSRVIVGYFLENFVKLYVQVLGYTPTISTLNHYRWGIKKTADGYAINMPFHLESRFGYSWVGHDLGPVVTGLFKIYPEKLNEINNVDFDVDHDRASLGEMIDEISKGTHCFASYVKMHH